MPNFYCTCDRYQINRNTQFLSSKAQQHQAAQLQSCLNIQALYFKSNTCVNKFIENLDQNYPGVMDKYFSMETSLNTAKNSNFESASNPVYQYLDPNKTFSQSTRLVLFGLFVGIGIIALIILAYAKLNINTENEFNSSTTPSRIHQSNNTINSISHTSHLNFRPSSTCGMSVARTTSSSISRVSNNLRNGVNLPPIGHHSETGRGGGRPSILSRLSKSSTGINSGFGFRRGSKVKNLDIESYRNMSRRNSIPEKQIKLDFMNSSSK